MEFWRKQTSIYSEGSDNADEHSTRNHHPSQVKAVTKYPNTMPGGDNHFRQPSYPLLGCFETADTRANEITHRPRSTMTGVLRHKLSPGHQNRDVYACLLAFALSSRRPMETDRAFKGLLHDCWASKHGSKKRGKAKNLLLLSFLHRTYPL